MDIQINGSVYSSADGASLESAKKTLVDLQAKLAKVRADILYYQGRIAYEDSGRASCTTKACRAMHDRANAGNTTAINNLNGQIAPLQKEIEDQQKRVNELQKAYNDQLASESQAKLTSAQADRLINPEIQKSMNELEALMKKKKTTVIIVVSILVLIAIGGGIWGYLKYKNKI